MSLSTKEMKHRQDMIPRFIWASPSVLNTIHAYIKIIAMSTAICEGKTKTINLTQ